MSCYLTRTTATTHKIIRDNLEETPKYGGWMDAAGPRYCPSIEDKIVRFADKDSHQVSCLAVAGTELVQVTRPRNSVCQSQSWPVSLQAKCSQLQVAVACSAQQQDCAVQIFLEPEGRNTPELYVQGFSTGLPERLQLALLHSLPGAAPHQTLL